jgi:hypothetical protein
VKFNLGFSLDRHLLVWVFAATMIAVLLYRGATFEQIDALLNAGLLGAGVLAGRSLQGPRPGNPA